MKRFRHYLAVMLCISMLFCIMPAVNAATDTDYICSTVRFTDGSGNALTSITAGTLKASMTVKPNTDAPDSLVFALLLYSDNKLIASDSMTRSVSGGAEFSAQVTVPDSASDCKAVAVLWNSVNDMRAICAAAVFPGGVNLLRGLTVDGNTITGFDSAVNEYTVTVEGDASVKPVINAETANNASIVKYIGNKAFPGKTIVELALADGSNTTTYTVNYKNKTELAANAHIVNPTGGNYGTFDIGKNLNTGDGGNVKDSSRTVENGRLGSRLHWDRNQPANYNNGYTNEVRGISEDYKFLLGSDYLMSTAEASRRADIGYQTCFTLYRSATLYVLSSEATTAEGWDLQKNTQTPFMTVQNDSERKLTNLSTKHFEVSDTSAGLDITIPAETMYSVNSGGKKSGGVSITAIVYDGYTTIGDNEQDISPEPSDKPKSGADSVKIAKTNDDGTEEILAGAPTEVSKNLTPYTDENPSDGSIIMFDRGRHASYPDYNNIKEIAADYSFIIGCDYIGQPAQGDSPSHRASAGYETSFKLYEGATVYVFTSTGNSDKAAENSWTYLESGNDLPFMKLRTKPTEEGDAVVGLTSVMSKHFDGAESGETVVIPKELLYRTGGDVNSSGFTLFVIKYDK